MDQTISRVCGPGCSNHNNWGLDPNFDIKSAQDDSLCPVQPPQGRSRLPVQVEHTLSTRPTDSGENIAFNARLDVRGPREISKRPTSPPSLVTDKFEDVVAGDFSATEQTLESLYANLILPRGRTLKAFVKFSRDTLPSSVQFRFVHHMTHNPLFHPWHKMDVPRHISRDRQPPMAPSSLYQPL